MVRQAESLVHHEGVSFQVGNGEDLRPLRDATADFVLTFTVFQHMPDLGLIEGYVSEAARILKPGGVLAAQWNKPPAPVEVESARRIVAAGPPRSLARKAGPEDRSRVPGRRVPVARIRGMCERSGLEVVAVRGEGTLFAWVWSRKPAPATQSDV